MRAAWPLLPARNADLGPTSDHPSSVTQMLEVVSPLLSMMRRNFLSFVIRLLAVGAYGLTPSVSKVPFAPAAYICCTNLKTLGFDRRLSGSPAVTIDAVGSACLIAA